MRPWEREPEKVDLVDEVTGLPIAIRRGPMGHWCGYIGIPSDHPWHGKDYDFQQPMPEGWSEASEATIDEVGVINIICASADDLKGSAPLTLLVRCHGGLTYADKGEFIGNAAADWWLGFDCAHAGDLCPKFEGGLRSGIYRDADFVIAQARKAAGDIAKFSQLVTL